MTRATSSKGTPPRAPSATPLSWAGSGLSPINYEFGALPWEPRLPVGCELFMEQQPEPGEPRGHEGTGGDRRRPCQPCSEPCPHVRHRVTSRVLVRLSGSVISRISSPFQGYFSRCPAEGAGMAWGQSPAPHQGPKSPFCCFWEPPQPQNSRAEFLGGKLCQAPGDCPVAIPCHTVHIPGIGDRVGHTELPSQG